jgi:ATP-dependent DNA helicase
VAPLSTLPNWEKEFKKWSASIPVLVYHDTKELRGMLRQKLDAVTANKKRKLSFSDVNGSESYKGRSKISADFDDEGELPVIVTSYDIAINDRKYLQKYKWKYLVVDEAHRLKNFECKLIIELRQLFTDNRLLLTGTPLQNNLTELWSLLNFILPDIFDNVTNFQKWCVVLIMQCSR